MTTQKIDEQDITQDANISQHSALLQQLKSDLEYAENVLSNYRPDPDQYHDAFDRHLYSMYGNINVCGLLVNAAYVLKKTDIKRYEERLELWLEMLFRDNPRFLPEYESLENAVSSIQWEIDMLEQIIEKERGNHAERN